MAALTSLTTTRDTERGRHRRRSLKHATSALAKTARGGYSRRLRGGDCTLADAGGWGRGFMYGVVSVAPGIDSTVNLFIEDLNLKEGSRGLMCAGERRGLMCAGNRRGLMCRWTQKVNMHMRRERWLMWRDEH